MSLPTIQLYPSQSNWQMPRGYRYLVAVVAFETGSLKGKEQSASITSQVLPSLQRTVLFATDQQQQKCRSYATGNGPSVRDDVIRNLPLAKVMISFANDKFSVWQTLSWRMRVNVGLQSSLKRRTKAVPLSQLSDRMERKEMGNTCCHWLGPKRVAHGHLLA